MIKRISLLSILLPSLAGLALLSTEAAASSLSATDLINGYNAIVFTDLTSSSEMDGNALVGGNVTGGGYGNHYPNIPTATSALTVGGNLLGNVTIGGPGLTVGGSISTTSLNFNKGGNVYVGGNLTSGWNANFNGNGNVYVAGSALKGTNVTANGGNVYFGGTVQSGANVTANGGGSVYQNSTVPASVVPNVSSQVSTAKSELTSYSAQLSGLAANSSYSENGTQVTFNAAPNSQGIAVLDLYVAAAATLLNQASQFEFDLNGAKEFIINVSGIDGTALTLNANFAASSSVGSPQSLGLDTLWNFTDATDITINRQFGGDILAAVANLTVNGTIEGTVIANALTQNAEIHYDGAQPNLVSPVPLPASLPMFVGALVGLGALARRHRHGGRAA